MLDSVKYDYFNNHKGGNTEGKLYCKRLIDFLNNVLLLVASDCTSMEEKAERNAHWIFL